MFLITKPPFKSENTRQGILHAVGCYTVIEEEVEPVVVFVGPGVLNCVSNQGSESVYGIESNADEIKKLLLSEAEVLACKEDVERYAIADRIVDASEFDADTEIKITPFEKIEKKMEECRQLLVF